MPTIVNINGKNFKKEEAMVSVYDHGLLYGDGVFEGIRTYSGKVFRLKDHIDRLYSSASAICLEIPIPKKEMIERVNNCVKDSGMDDNYIRLIVTRGAGNLGLDPRKTSNPQVITIVDGIQLYPEEMYEKGLGIIISSIMRIPNNSLSPRIKSLNYLNNILAKIEAIQADFFEAVMLNNKGEVTECTGDNIFVCKNGIIRTPPLSAGVLGGITRDTVIELAQKAKYKLIEEAVVTYDLFEADEIFLTGSAAEIIPVVKVDRRTIGEGVPGPIFKDLRSKYIEYVRS